MKYVFKIDFFYFNANLMAHPTSYNLCLLNKSFSDLLKESMGALRTQAVELQNIQCLGEEILASCHPDSIITLKSWISVTKTRYEEVGALLCA